MRCARSVPTRSPTCRSRRARFCTRSAGSSSGMFTATKGKALLTTTTGALPRPGWYTANLRGMPLSYGLSQAAYREQHFDCLACNVVAQRRAGIDIFVDGDARLDDDVAGRSWVSYATERIAGIGTPRVEVPPAHFMADKGPGDLMWEVIETRMTPPVEATIRPLRRAQPRVPRARRCRRAHRADRGTGHPSGDRRPERDHRAGAVGGGVQRRGRRLARQMRGVVPHLLGQPRRPARGEPRPVLQGRAAILRSTRRGRLHLRRRVQPRPRFRAHRPDDRQGQEGRTRRCQPPHAAGRAPGGGRPADPSRAPLYRAGAADLVERLRLRPAVDEPHARLLQDARAGARRQHGAPGTRIGGSLHSGSRSATVNDTAGLAALPWLDDVP